MVHIEEEEFSIEVLEQPRDLGTNALPGRAVCRDEQFPGISQCLNVLYYSCCFKSRKNWSNALFRQQQEIPKRNSKSSWEDSWAFGFTVPGDEQSWSHFTLCESFDFMLFKNLRKEYDIIGIQCMTEGRHPSPPISAFWSPLMGWLSFYTIGTFARRLDLDQMVGWYTPYGVFSVPKHMLLKTSPENAPSTDTPVETLALFHFLMKIATVLMVLKILYLMIHNSRRKKLMILPSDLRFYRQLCSATWIEWNSCFDLAYQFLRLSQFQIRQNHLRSIFAKAIFSQVDFITGDFDLFANRQFSSDWGGSVYSGVALEVLEDVVRETNRHLSQKITYKDVFEFKWQGELNANLDCSFYISLFYNKQKYQERRPQPLMTECALAHDYLHNVLERPRQLCNYDVCLKRTDGDWHRPLLVRVHAHAIPATSTQEDLIPNPEEMNLGWEDEGDMTNQLMAETPAIITDRTLVRIIDPLDHNGQVGTAEDLNRYNGHAVYIGENNRNYGWRNEEVKVHRYYGETCIVHWSCWSSTLTELVFVVNSFVRSDYHCLAF